MRPPYHPVDEAIAKQSEYVPVVETSQLSPLTELTVRTRPVLSGETALTPKVRAVTLVPVPSTGLGLPAAITDEESEEVMTLVKVIPVTKVSDAEKLAPPEITRTVSPAARLPVH